MAMKGETGVGGSASISSLRACLMPAILDYNGRRRGRSLGMVSSTFNRGISVASLRVYRI